MSRPEVESKYHAEFGIPHPVLRYTVQEADPFSMGTLEPLSHGVDEEREQCLDEELRSIEKSMDYINSPSLGHSWSTVLALERYCRQHVGTFLMSSAKFCAPSIIFSVCKKQSLESSKPLRQTSALDGIRGFACLAVMNYHVLYVYQGFVFYGYGLSKDSLAFCGRTQDQDLRNDWIHQLPIIRLLYSGTASVSLFFIISGFVLAYKPLMTARQHDHVAVFRIIGSSTFRRGLRLFLPPIIMTFFTMLAVWAGLLENGSTLTKDRSFITEIPEHHPKRFSSLSEQLLHWIHDVSKMVGAYSWKEYFPHYDVHLWTIGGEFRASMIIFLILTVYVSLRQPHRLAVQLVLMFYTYCWNRWETVLFLTGMLLADTSQLSHAESQSGYEGCLVQPRSRPRSQRTRAVALKGLRLFLLLASLYLLSAPDLCIQHTPGFKLLGRLIPPFDHQPFRFYPMIGGTMLVFLVSHSSHNWSVNRLVFNSATAQYLGRISYSLYLVHGPVIHSFGYIVFAWMLKMVGQKTILQYCIAFGLAYILLLAAVVWVADVFWRGVDMQCVWFAAWLERQILEYPNIEST